MSKTDVVYDPVDPIPWLKRLQYIAENSSFTMDQKQTIYDCFETLMMQLGGPRD